MSFDGLPPSAQWSSSKSQFLSPKFRTLLSEIDFPFIGNFPETLKSCSDLQHRSTMAQERIWNRSPIPKNRAPIFPETNVSKSLHNRTTILQIGARFWPASELQNNPFSSFWLMHHHLNCPKLHKNCTKNDVWPSVITSPNLHHYLPSRNKL